MEKLTKKDIISNIAEDSRLTKKDITEVVDLALTQINLHSVAECT